jgi:hypothetical protein
MRTSSRQTHCARHRRVHVLLYILSAECWKTAIHFAPGCIMEAGHLRPSGARFEEISHTRQRRAYYLANQSSRRSHGKASRLSRRESHWRQLLPSLAHRMTVEPGAPSSEKIEPHRSRNQPGSAKHPARSRLGSSGMRLRRGFASKPPRPVRSRTSTARRTDAAP